MENVSNDNKLSKNDRSGKRRVVAKHALYVHNDIGYKTLDDKAAAMRGEQPINPKNIVYLIENNSK